MPWVDVLHYLTAIRLGYVTLCGSTTCCSVDMVHHFVVVLQHCTILCDTAMCCNGLGVAALPPFTLHVNTLHRPVPCVSTLHYFFEALQHVAVLHGIALGSVELRATTMYDDGLCVAALHQSASRASTLCCDVMCVSIMHHFVVFLQHFAVLHGAALCSDELRVTAMYGDGMCIVALRQFALRAITLFCSVPCVIPLRCLVT